MPLFRCVLFMAHSIETVEVSSERVNSRVYCLQSADGCIDEVIRKIEYCLNVGKTERVVYPGCEHGTLCLGVSKPEDSLVLSVIWFVPADDFHVVQMICLFPTD